MSKPIVQVGAGTKNIGLVDKDQVSFVILHIDSMAGIAIQPKVRAQESDFDYLAVGCKKRTEETSDTAVATIVEPGVYAIDVAGLELQLDFDDDAEYAYTMVIG